MEISCYFLCCVCVLVCWLVLCDAMRAQTGACFFSLKFVCSIRILVIGCHNNLIINASPERERAISSERDEERAYERVNDRN